MLAIPIQQVPSQLSRVVLGNQNCQINIYQKSQGCFVDINSDGVDIVVGVIAKDVTPLVCREYSGFIGNLLFVDTQGNDDPSYSGFGSRWVLIYLTAEEYALIR
jgi:hypothetical protein